MEKHGKASKPENGQLREFFRVVVRCLPDLGEAEMQKWIDSPQALRKALRESLASDGKIVQFKHDKIKDGWELIEPGPELESGKPFVPDIVEFLRGESSVNGEVMRQRARELNANLGQRHAEYLLEHQELIPKEWRGKYYLVFPGTVWQNSDGYRIVPCLGWRGGRWCLDWYWLAYFWYGYDRLVGSRG